MEEIAKMFSIKKNIEKHRWEFEPMGNYIGYLVSFTECKEEDQAILAVYKNIKNGRDKQMA